MRSSAMTSRHLIIAALCAVGMLAGGCASSSNEPSATRSSSAPMGSGGASSSPAGGSFEEDFFAGDDVAAETHPDPLEPLNRAIFGFNDVAYTYILFPIGDAYDFVAPDPVEDGISNFFHNIRMPERGISALFQGKPGRAGQEVRNFAVNSTVGLLGFFKPSKDMFDEQPLEEDVGQTFGVWGIPSGPYLVLPLLGPSNPRDLGGRVVGNFLDPLTYLDEWDGYEWEYEWTLRGVEFVNETPSRSEQYRQLKEDTVDPYSAMREGYMSFREKQISE